MNLIRATHEVPFFSVLFGSQSQCDVVVVGVLLILKQERFLLHLSRRFSVHVMSVKIKDLIIDMIAKTRKEAEERRREGLLRPRDGKD